MASNNRKETNTTNTDKDKMENSLAEDFENNAEISLEPVATQEINVFLFYLKKVSFSFSSKWSGFFSTLPITHRDWASSVKM